MNTQISPVLSAYELRRKQNEVVDKFFNRMQRQAMAINAHDEYIVASRGTGKSEGIDARIILRNVWEMPGSLGGLISPSYAKLGEIHCRPFAKHLPNGDTYKAFIMLLVTKLRKAWDSANQYVQY